MIKFLILIAGVILLAACALQKEVKNQDAENPKTKADSAFQELDKETGK
ncbi:MAG: hypothetical protein V1913_12465 [Fibrobacterota bacterium]